MLLGMPTKAQSPQCQRKGTNVVKSRVAVGVCNRFKFHLSGVWISISPLEVNGVEFFLNGVGLVLSQFLFR